jgi:hypothetical protein
VFLRSAAFSSISAHPVLQPALSVRGALRLIGAAGGDGGLSAEVLDIDLDGEPVTPVADLLATLGVPFLFATCYGEEHDPSGHGARKCCACRSLRAR